MEISLEPPFREFGKFVGQHMRERSLTDDDLAASVGISLEYLERIKQGTRLPTWRVAIGMAKAFGLEPEDVAREMSRYCPSVEDLDRTSMSIDELMLIAKDPVAGRVFLEKKFAHIKPDTQRVWEVDDWLEFARTLRETTLRNRGDLPPKEMH